MVVKIGMIGCGTIAWYHLRQIKALDSAEIVAVYNRSAGPRENFGKNAGLHADALYSDIENLLQHQELDAVVNCLPNKMHSSISIQALETGLHVLCEKPMATSLNEAKEMINAAKRNNKKLMIGLTQRFTGEIIAAKQVVDQGVLGEIYYTKAGWMRRNGIPGWGSQFTRSDLAGAGPIYDIGVHALDTACWIMSNFQADKVLASSYAKFGPEKRGLGNWGVPDQEGYFDVEDLASAIIKMKNGATITFEVSWAAHVPSSHFTVRILGDKAGLDLEAMNLYTTAEEEINTPISFEETDAYFKEMEHFVDCIQNNVAPITTPQQMLELQAMLDMILLSSRETKVIKRQEI